MVTPMSAGIRAAVFATLCAALLGACRLSTELPALATATYTVGQPPAFTASSTTTPVPAGSATVGPSPSAVAAVESLKATVSADLLSCRYGPGPDYLFLYGLRKGANIILVGRTNGDNWPWAYVQGKSPCWVKTDFLDVHGEWLSLPVVYPGLAKLPISPYYPATTVLSATRQKDKVTVRWLDVRDRGNETKSVGMLCVSVDAGDWTTLDHVSSIHDCHTITGLSYHTQVVSHQYQAHADLMLDVQQQFEDLVLNGYIYRSGGLVRKQQARRTRE